MRGYPPKNLVGLSYQSSQDDNDEDQARRWVDVPTGGAMEGGRVGLLFAPWHCPSVAHPSGTTSCFLQRLDLEICFV